MTKILEVKSRKVFEHVTNLIWKALTDIQRIENNLKTIIDNATRIRTNIRYESVGTYRGWVEEGKYMTDVVGVTRKQICCFLNEKRN